jgi:hypothetical protein
VQTSSPQIAPAGTPAPSDLSYSFSTSASERLVLYSWKDIANYFEKGVRTVQRWEHELGLPVRRIGAGSKAPVFAFREEVDSWLRGQS